MPGRSPYAGASELLALGQAVRELRERRGEQQKAADFDAGVADGYIGRLETGHNNPSFMVLLRAVRTLDGSLAPRRLPAIGVVPRREGTQSEG